METKKHPSSHPAGTGQGRTKTARQSRWLLLIAILLMLFGTSLDAKADDQADYERALESIKDYHLYRIYSEVDGQKYYINQSGSVTTSVDDACYFLFQKVGGDEYEYGFWVIREGGLVGVFTYCEDIEDSYSLSYELYQGNPSRLRNAQVFFLNEEGRYAVRSTNIAHGEEDINLWGSAYWTIKLDGEGNVCAGYSYEKNYLWQLEEDEIYRNVYPEINRHSRI